MLSVTPAPAAEHSALIVQVFMLLWSYFVAVATEPGLVPPGWHPFPDEQASTVAEAKTTARHACKLS